MISLVVALATAWAAPGFIPVQGTLADDAGTAIDGQVDVTFTLYTDSGGGTSVWSDTMTLDVVDGRFAAELGSGTQLDLASFASYPTVHLQIQVAGDTAMPLVPLDHVPYAAWAEQAGDAATLGGSTVGELRAEIPAVSDIEAAARAAAFDTEAELTTLLDDNYVAAGYVPEWTDLTNRPAGLDDGDDVGFTTEAELTTLLDDNYRPIAWVPAWTDITSRPAGLDDGDDVLSETDVDGYVANNGYALSSTLADVATSGDWNDLTNMPINVRTIVTKADADAICGGATAVHVPRSFRGQTGNAICAADARGLNTCVSVPYVYVTNANAHGGYAANNLTCASAVNYPWPWGAEYSSPNSLSSEWGHGTTYVVCCQ